MANESAFPMIIRNGLSLEEQALLLELGDGLYTEVLRKTLKILIDAQTTELCTIRADSGRDALLIAKARLEGAQQLVKMLVMLY